MQVFRESYGKFGGEVESLRVCSAKLRGGTATALQKIACQLLSLGSDHTHCKFSFIFK